MNIAMTNHQQTNQQIEDISVKSKSGRKSSAAAEIVPIAVDRQSASNQVAVLDARADRVRAVALQMGYQLPGDSVDADLIQRDIAANMRRSVEACLEVGRGLAALKASCEHGEFGKRLEVLGIEFRVSQRFMLAAARFANATLAPHLVKAIGTQSKLFELLVLNDEELEELAEGGEVRGLDADDIAGMTRNELRAALKESRESLEAKDRVLADKNAHIDRLEEQTSKKFKPRAGSIARSLEEQRVVDEIQEATAAAQLDMRRLFAATDSALIEAGQSESVQLMARQAVEYLCQQMLDVSTEFGIAVNLEERLKPSWLSEDAIAAMEKRQAEREAAQK